MKKPELTETEKDLYVMPSEYGKGSPVLCLNPESRYRRNITLATAKAIIQDINGLKLIERFINTYNGKE